MKIIRVTEASCTNYSRYNHINYSIDESKPFKTIMGISDETYNVLTNGSKLEKFLRSCRFFGYQREIDEGTICVKIAKKFPSVKPICGKFESVRVECFGGNSNGNYDYHDIHFVDASPEEVYIYNNELNKLRNR